MQPSYSTPQTAANAAPHRVGHDVNAVDQLSSVVLLGLACAGAAVALLILHFVVG